VAQEAPLAPTDAKPHAIFGLIAGTNSILSSREEMPMFLSCTSHRIAPILSLVEINDINSIKGISNICLHNMPIQ
jgi:hypothetical protein